MYLFLFFMDLLSVFLRLCKPNGSPCAMEVDHNDQVTDEKSKGEENKSKPTEKQNGKKAASDDEDSAAGAMFSCLICGQEFKLVGPFLSVLYIIK